MTKPVPTGAYENLLEKLGASGKQMTFLQVGAADGKSFDRLYEFVKRYRWPGILIEPLPDLFEELKRNYAGHDNLIFENYAVSDSVGTRVMQRVPFKLVQDGIAPPWSLGISSFYTDRNPVGGVHVHEFYYSQIKDFITSEQVNCAPLKLILQPYSITRIDIVQIDTEGYDYEVLRQIDFKKYSPKIIYFEYCHLPDEEQKLAEELLRGHGYDCDVAGPDMLAVRRQGSERIRSGLRAGTKLISDKIGNLLNRS